MIMMLCLASDATGVRVLGGCVGYGTTSIVAVLAVAAAAEVGGCSCRDCGGGIAWARGSGHADAATTAGCCRAALAAGCHRGERGREVGEGFFRKASVRPGKGRGAEHVCCSPRCRFGSGKTSEAAEVWVTRLDAVMAAACHRAAWVAGCRRRWRGCLVLGLGHCLGGCRRGGCGRGGRDTRLDAATTAGVVGEGVGEG